MIFKINSYILITLLFLSNILYTQNIIVEGNEGYQKTKNYMKLMMPKQLKKVKKFREKLPLFFKENIE